MKKIFSLFILSVVFISVTGIASAATFGPVGPDFALCNPDSTSKSYQCTTQVMYEDGDFVEMQSGKEIQSMWDLEIPENAIILEAKVHILGKETDPDIKTNIQLWSSYTDDHLSEYQSFPEGEWAVLTFNDERIKQEVEERIKHDELILLELDFEEDQEGYEENNVQINYIWLEIIYVVPRIPPNEHLYPKYNCEEGVCLMCYCHDRDLSERGLIICEDLPQGFFERELPKGWIEPTCENDVFTSCHCHKLIERPYKGDIKEAIKEKRQERKDRLEKIKEKIKSRR